MADDAVIGTKGLRIEIERGSEVQSTELDAALEQLAQAVANLDAPEPLDEDEVAGFGYDMKDMSRAPMKVGKAMGGLPKIGGMEMGWCVSRCGSYSDGGDCGAYCWIEG